MKTNPLFGDSKILKQLLDRRADQVGMVKQRTILRGNAPNSTVNMIPTRIPEVHFPVLDDRVVPVGDVDRTIRTHFDIDWTKGDMIGFDQFDFLSRTVGRSILTHDEPANPVGAEIIGDHGALPFRWQMSTTQDLKPAMFWTARIQTAQDTLCSRGGDKDGTRENVVDSLTISTIGREGLAPFIEVMPPRIDEAFA